MPPKLELVVKAVDQASETLRGIRREVEGLAGTDAGVTDAQRIAGLQTAAAAAAGLAAALYTAEKAAFEMVKDWADYTITVADFADKLGISKDEAAGIIALADDFDVSMGTIESAFIAMAKNGLEPSLAGLAEARRLIDEAGTPAERLALATKLFGQAGADLLPILATLNDEQLRDYVDNLSEARRVTDEEEKSAREMNRAIGDMELAWGDVKLAIGGFLATEGNLVEGFSSMAKLIGGQISLLEYLRELWQTVTGFWGRALGLNPPLPGSPGSPATQAHPTPAMKPDLSAYYASERGRASGGPVGAGGIYTVGERGPETFIPGESGSVAPNDLLTEIRGMREELQRMTRALPVMMRDAVERLL